MVNFEILIKSLFSIAKQLTPLFGLTNQSTFTCLKLTIETQEKVWNMYKVNNKNTRTISIGLFSCLFFWLRKYFKPFASVSIVDFEQLNFS